MLADPIRGRGKDMIDDANEWIRLRRSDDPEDQQRAMSEAVPVAVWAQVYERAPDLRPFIAAHREVASSILERLGNDADAAVRLAVAQRNDLPEKLLRLLADDRHEQVRLAVAANPSTRKDVLQYLSRVDGAESVRLRASVRLKSLTHPSSHS